MNNRARKPLRRTAWTLSLGGLVLLGLMVITGIVAANRGQDVGGGKTVIMPADQSAMLFRPLGPQPAGASSIRCTATPQGVDGNQRSLPLGESILPAPPGVVITIACNQPAKLLTGSARSISETVRSPLILVPVGMIIIGLAFFVPRLTWTFARMGAPFSRRRLTDGWQPRRPE